MLEKVRQEKRATVIPFVVAGDPDMPTTEKAIDILVEEGAEILEIGVPFSDALADGQVIQQASERAARKHDSIRDVLSLATRVSKKHPALQCVLFTYYNPIFKMGMETFAREAAAAGIKAVLVVDLPPESAMEYRATLHAHGLKTVFLASPTTSQVRLAKIADASSGFIYYVSRTGVTGVQSDLSASLRAEVEAIRRLTDKPIAVGFGISTPDQAATVSAIADAVVVGSAFVKLLTLPGAEDNIRKLMREIVAAVRKTPPKA